MKFSSESSVWALLQKNNKKLQEMDRRSLVSARLAVGKPSTLQVGPLWLDYSRHLIDETTLGLLHQLSDDAGIGERIGALFTGQMVNTTERRPALHTLLRAPDDSGVTVDGKAVWSEVEATRIRMLGISDQIRSGEWRGATGKPVSDLIVVGIGGSELGPRLVCTALQHLTGRVRVHFFANVDAGLNSILLDQLDPESTLLCVVSKSFVTGETRLNANLVREWLESALGTDRLHQHLLAVSSNVQAACDFGIDEAHVLPMWDWVGGRYSLWSAVGLPIAVALGAENFTALLGGAHAMDRHFASAPAAQNMPIIMGLLAIWYRNFWGTQSHAVVCYDDRLEPLPGHLQQVDMESNGKSVRIDGSAVGVQSAPVLWGGVGTNAQHAFFQALHQGTLMAPLDLIGVIHPDHRHAGNHRTLLSNLLGQAAALYLGQTAEQSRAEMRAQGLDEPQIGELLPHRTFTGGHPCNLLLLDRLTAESLGALIALYEHRTFVQAQIWGINAFDQWGVELGKRLASEIEPALAESGESAGLDLLSAAAVSHIRGR